ncbi:hypothetical protein FRC01_014572 [Tulasnella sp. 417]|nr:hypothetical protein FRC01_014572 [Tulasnella sp. 417]
MNTTYPDKFRRRIVERWEALGVKFFLGDRGSLPQGDYTSITTEKGRTIKADLVVPTWGGRRNTAFLKSFDPTIVTAQENIRVLPTLQVPLSNGKTNVYAVGDVIDWPEQKQLAKIPSHVAVVVPNILASIEGKKAPKVYGGFMEAILLPAGPTAGVMYLPLLWGLVLGDWVSSLLKAKTLFVHKAQALTGYA